MSDEVIALIICSIGIIILAGFNIYLEYKLNKRIAEFKNKLALEEKK